MTPVEMAVRTIIDLLVRGQYDVVAKMGRLSATQISEAISEYGRTLVLPESDEWWPLVTVTPSAEPGEVHVAAPLWTAEEGRSDLTLELSLTEVVPEGDWTPEFGELWQPDLLDIHVL